MTRCSSPRPSAIAIGASTVALLLFIWLRNNNTRRGRIYRVCAAVVMGLAIAGMHYTGMAAARFTPADAMPMNGSHVLDSAGLALPVVMGAFVILTLTVAGSITDHWVRVKLAGAEALRESEERYRLRGWARSTKSFFERDAAGQLDISQLRMDEDHGIQSGRESRSTRARFGSCG